ncbi:DNA circularization N-terminal domain-containing protein [Burkholderia arboris]|uniref:DNA circularization N-terminal domain-containing protein n=1 Tax=Burkholderia metallica TaxID=488729 RepID=A0ABT8PEW6_9BURK|nr:MULTISPECIES: DNA circularization N-terminal domain-containing protein [Burkholderia cepacia complex]MCA8038040.1 DNA circularization N-terminal domain-containing protein [Burkholderia arboris]MDN7933670.1 DNA circularization N-terminal domain-containing protein [Burkholderia metallica]
MSWRDKLRPASFRGVPFQVFDDKTPVGRRVVVHDYPRRDSSYPEDNGKQTREYRMTAFVIGRDCFDQRDRLLDALEQDGAGELIHPWLGTLRVQAGECDMTHTKAEGGMVSFTLVFHDAPDLKYPGGVANTGKQALGSADGLLDTALNRYRDAVELVNLAQVTVDGLMQQGGSIFDVLYRYASPFTVLFGSVRSFVETLVEMPGSIADRFASAFDTGWGVGVAPERYSEAISGALGKVGAISTLEEIAPPRGREAGKLFDATIDLVQDVLLVEVVRDVGELPAYSPAVLPAGAPALDVQITNPMAAIDVPVADDLRELAEVVSESMWQQGMTAPREHFQALTNSRLKVAQHLAKVAREGVGLVTIRPPQSVPALVLAHRRYGDATRADEIVMRNRVAHPGFVPAVRLELLSQ